MCFKNKIFIIIISCLLFSIGFIAGFSINRQGPVTAGEIDREYYYQYGRTTEIIERIENELRREQHINRQLREHNTRARELNDDLTGTVERNVRNLQDAIILIGEIRKKIKVLADFYSDSDTGNGDY